MIKFNQFKPIIFLLSFLSIGSSIIISQPYSPMEITHDGSENNTETVSKNQSAYNFKLYDADGKIYFELSDEFNEPKFNELCSKIDTLFN